MHAHVVHTRGLGQSTGIRENIREHHRRIDPQEPRCLDFTQDGYARERQRAHSQIEKFVFEGAFDVESHVSERAVDDPHEPSDRNQDPAIGIDIEVTRERRIAGDFHAHTISRLESRRSDLGHLGGDPVDGCEREKRQYGKTLLSVHGTGSRIGKKAALSKVGRTG